MTITKPQNNQLTPHLAQTEAQPVVSKPPNQLEQPPIKLTGDLSRIAGLAAGAPASSSPSPAAAAQLEPAGHTTTENSSRAEAERQEIVQRIAAFRKLQVRLRQEREKYYDAELDRARSLLSKSLTPRR
ncbi:hypothetical protein LPW26_10510 [Rhodopseudomonas sp. HC1]|uniref:hypothetical protein n=1 Tax=Rhodopseudomonas infernalis TaxID=2897386 RepID=UPI001EE7C1AA|nr:hypothetical protein [Rhodopseudomonas infernalis]MCG6205070.1 hypothetical protein [Rhodopseudomonas infernalis]